MIYKRCSRCGSRVPAGTTCPCRKNNIREYAKPTGVKKEYHTQRWKNLRQFVLNSYDGLDIYMMYKHNRIVAADTVHHIELSQDRPDLFYSDSNLIPVSRAGHKEVHARYEREGKTVVQEFHFGGDRSKIRTRARPMKPVSLQKKHLTIVEGQKKADAEDQVRTEKNQLKRPPTWLIDDVAKKEWRRIIKELDKLNIVGNLDRNNIGGYCNAFANYVKATEILSQQTYYVDRETRTGVIVVKNPMVDIQKGYAEEMRRFAALCGLTIDSRLKAGTAKVNKQQKEIENRFGAI